MSKSNNRTITKGAGLSKAQPDGPVHDASMPGYRPRIGVLVNPFSGGNRSGLTAVRTTITAHPRVLHCDVQTPRDILMALIDFARSDVNLVVVNGGDGTVQAALTALFYHRPFESLPLLAVLQSGTTSMTARDVGFAGSAVKALERIFSWAQTGTGTARVIHRPVLQVKAPGHEPHYGMFFGTAGVYQGIQYFHRNINSRGLKGELGPGLTIARFLWSASLRRSDFISPHPITVALDDRPPEQMDCLLLLVSTLERMFLGLYPYWGAEKGDLHYTALRARPRRLMQALPSILWGRSGRHARPENGFFSHNASEIKLNFDCGFTIDGQLFTPANSGEPTVVQSGATAAFLRIAP